MSDIKPPKEPKSPKDKEKEKDKEKDKDSEFIKFVKNFGRILRLAGRLLVLLLIIWILWAFR